MTRKDVRAVPPAAGDLRGILLDLRESVQQLLGTRGDPLARAVTFADVTPGSGSSGGTIIVNPDGGVGEEPDLTPPPTPTGLAVSAGLTNIYVEWDAPTYLQGHGHGRVAGPGRLTQRAQVNSASIGAQLGVVAGGVARGRSSGLIDEEPPPPPLGGLP